jgi:hypothetical protein
MTLFERHPEELLQRDSRGDALSAAERESLFGHLSGCATCRAVRLATADFARAKELDPGRVSNLDAMIHTALWETRPRAIPGRRGLRRRALLFAAAAVALLMGGAAAAARWSGVIPALRRAARGGVVQPPRSRSTDRRKEAAAPPSPPVFLAQAPAIAGVAPAPPVPPRRLALGSPPPATRPIAGAALPPPGATTSPEETTAQAVVFPSRRVAARPERAPRKTPPGLGPPQPAATAPSERFGLRSDAAQLPWESLFVQAGRERLAGRTRPALALYDQLARTYPRSPEGRAANAIKGRLELDGGDTAAALRDLEAYLRSGGGPLEEEALVGEAEALRQAGRADDERATWELLTSRFPASPHGPRARARLAELRDRRP